MRTHNGQMCRREFLKTTTAAVAASAGIGSTVVPRLVRAGEARPRASRISYFCNGEIHVNEIGKPEEKPLTTGHMDFKPSWSKTGNMLVCFRRTKNDPVTVNWKSAIFVINVDGTGFHQLSDGTRTDFNPTWTRDGKNTPIWNRKNEKNGGFHVMQSKVGGKPGEEIALTDEHFHNWAHSCLTDGRIFVNSAHPKMGFGVFLMTRSDDGKPLYERVQWELNAKGQMHRASISPSEKKICFEYLAGTKFTEPGHTLYIADFDAQKRTITNPKAFANKEGKPIWFAYPRWIDGESAVIYHSTETGKGQLYVYRLEDDSTKRVSTNAKADYRYPHGEAAPC
ncbi:MAG: twin-arginine translocation signal domain-containing protein [Verrucomicrobia bacterium]|nr:twin-arginine translocation signal domain-containing protein [Verrucomicrobiota bacterium]